MLKSLYDKKEDIPEKYVDLFSKNDDDKWVLTEVTGMKPEEDVTKLRNTLNNERTEHKQKNRELKQKLEKYEDLGTVEEITEKIDSIPELQAKAKGGKLDDEEINKLVDGRVERKTASLTRDLEKITGERDELLITNDQFKKRETTRKIHDSLRDAASGQKVIQAAMDDVLLLGERMFHVDEDGQVVTKADNGTTPGVEPKAWLAEMKGKRPHWWPPSEGGGAGGGKGPGAGGKNPWSEDGWNLSEQGQYLRQHGVEAANKLAASVSSKVGATKPTISKK